MSQSRHEADFFTSTDIPADPNNGKRFSQRARRVAPADFATPVDTARPRHQLTFPAQPTSLASSPQPVGNRLRHQALVTGVTWANIDGAPGSPMTAKLSSRRALAVPPSLAPALPPAPVTPERRPTAQILHRPQGITVLRTAEVDPTITALRESDLQLPPLQVALAAREIEAATTPWWKTTSDGRTWRMPTRMLVAASVVAILGVAVSYIPNTSTMTTDEQLASAASPVTVAPDRESLEALQEASRSFIRASVTTPSTMAPTTTTTAPPPTTTTTKTPAAKVVVPNEYAGCSKSKQAAKDCWWSMLDQYSWDTQTAFNILWCESTGNPNAKNPRSTATGLFQILGGTTDPAANVKQAHDMYKARGWQPWVCKG